MRYLLFTCLLFFLSSATTCAQTKKIKVKGDRSVKYYYHPDSSALSHKENVKLMQGFYSFTRAIATDNYQAYLDALSPTTLKRIIPEKLERKYGKFRTLYNVVLKGKINIRYIKPFPRDTPEPNTVYICTIKLPDGQKIEKRVGFDMLKRDKFEGIENYYSLQMTATENGYKAVILW